MGTNLSLGDFLFAIFSKLEAGSWQAIKVLKAAG
jgi:hypothetical protein